MTLRGRVSIRSHPVVTSGRFFAKLVKLCLLDHALRPYRLARFFHDLSRTSITKANRMRTVQGKNWLRDACEAYLGLRTQWFKGTSSRKLSAFWSPGSLCKFIQNRWAFTHSFETSIPASFSPSALVPECGPTSLHYMPIHSRANGVEGCDLVPSVSSDSFLHVCAYFCV